MSDEVEYDTDYLKELLMRKRSKKLSTSIKNKVKKKSKSISSEIPKIEGKTPTKLRWDTAKEKYLILCFQKVNDTSGSSQKPKIWNEVANFMNKRFKEVSIQAQQCKNKFQELKSKYAKSVKERDCASHSGFGSDDLPGDPTALDEYINAHPNILQASSFVHFDLMAEIFGRDIFTGFSIYLATFFTNIIVFDFVSLFRRKYNSSKIY